MITLNLLTGHAIQVHPSELVISLKAYEKELPSIHGFKLCVRFGRGCPVTWIPNELVERIVRFVLDARATKYKAWSKNFSCFEGRCTHGSDSKKRCKERGDYWMLQLWYESRRLDKACRSLRCFVC